MLRDVPTMETLAAVELLRSHMPEFGGTRIIRRAVNLMKLQQPRGGRSSTRRCSDLGFADMLKTKTNDMST